MLDFKKIEQAFLNLFYPGDKYLLIEILDHYVQATAVRANLEKKKIRIVRNYLSVFDQFDALAILKELKRLLKKIRQTSKFKIILSLDSRLATTVYSSILLVRSKPNEAIDEADIDNLISQSVWQFFDRQRVKAAKKMSIEDVDVLLSDVKIQGIKIDGHKVINPVGFKAKFVEFYLRQTLVARDFIRELRGFLPPDKIILIAEAGTLTAQAVLGHTKADAGLLLAKIFPSQTILYSAAPGKLKYVDSFDWGQNNLLAALGEELAIEAEAARAIIDLYNDNKTSPVFARRLENVLIKELQIFLNGLEILADKEHENIYLHSYFNMPQVIFSPRCQSRLKKPVRINPVPFDSVAAGSGFELKLNKSAQTVKNLLSVLAPFSELSAPPNDQMSYLAKRRVRWLVV